MASASSQRTQYAGTVAFGWVLLALVSAGAGACSSPERGIEQESIELASGDYYDLAWGGTQVERFHVLAHLGTADGEVVIVSPQHEEPCSLGAVSGYATTRPDNGGKYVVGSPSPARIGIFDDFDDAGRGRLRFSDVDCKLTPLEVAGVMPSSIRSLASLDLSQIVLAVPLADRSLDYVQPWADKHEIVAHDVTSMRTRDDGVWLIEHGQAVARDHEGRELTRHGHGVRELLPLGKALDLAFVDDSGLTLRKADESVLVEKDACRVRSLGSFQRNAIGYFSPCDSRRLAVRHDKGGSVETFRYSQDIDSLFALDGRLLFTVTTDTQTELWTVSSSKPKQAERVLTLPHFQLDNLWSLGRGRYLLGARQDDDTLSLLRLNSLEPGSKPSTLQRHVVNLSVYESTIAITQTDHTLTLLDFDDQHELWHVEGVPTSGYRFLFQGRATAIAYRQHVDAATKLGALEVQFVSGEHLSIADDVREFDEVWWPERGLVYATGGAHAGLSFARIDVPCEKLSDSPWACGF